MKRLTFFIGLLLTFNNLSAQKTVIKNYKTNRISEVSFNLKFAKDIQVKNWSKNDVKIVAEVNLNNNTANNKFSLQQSITKRTLNIASNYKDFFKKHKHGNVTMIGNCVSEDTKDCTKIIVNYVVYLPKHIKVNIKSITGNVKMDKIENAIKTDLISGNIDVKTYTNNMNLKTVSGDIDVVVSNSEFKAQTVTGNVYSNLDITFNKNKKRSYSTKIAGNIGNGSKKLKLKTVSGDVLLRKE